MLNHPYLLQFAQTDERDLFILFHGSHVLATQDAFLFQRAELEGRVPADELAHVIEAGQQNYLALHVESSVAKQLEAEDRPLRSLVFAGDEQTLNLAGKANQIIEWYRTHRYCGCCGARTHLLAGQRALRCEACERHYFPRINPCIIVLVTRGREVLLARNARYRGEYYSCLAGFIEVGESAEQTLIREVREEVSVEVDNIRYIGSQAWPFPSQLMLGFWADYRGGEVVPDGVEITEATWFDIDALPTYPSAVMSVAGQLIERYVRHFRPE